MLSTLYGKIMSWRNALYDRGVLDTFHLGARTISVGNITTGGTGKTPLVAYIAKVLAGRGETICVLTRGYGRENAGQRVLVSDGEQVLADARTGGDEPVELARKLLGKAIIIADADRVAAAEWAKRKFAITTFILDDGFQHRKVRRDLDIVCIDATDPFGGDKMLPAGRLREPVDGLGRADVVIITRSDLVGDTNALRSMITTWNAGATICETTNTLSAIVPINGSRAATERPIGKKMPGPAFAFCGLGNPEVFFALLRREEIEVAGTRAFADHAVYTQKDVDLLCSEANASNAECLVTTAKDAVKLSHLTFEVPCFVVEIDTKIDDRKYFEAMLTT